MFFVAFLSFLFILSCTFRKFFEFKIIVSRQLMKDSKAALSVGGGGFFSFEFLVQGAVLSVSSVVFSEFCGTSLVWGSFFSALNLMYLQRNLLLNLSNAIRVSSQSIFFGNWTKLDPLVIRLISSSFSGVWLKFISSWYEVSAACSKVWVALLWVFLLSVC